MGDIRSCNPARPSRLPKCCRAMTGTQIYYREGAHGGRSPRGQRRQISEWEVWKLLRLPGGSVRGQGRGWVLAGDGIPQGWTSTVLRVCGLCHQHPSSLPCPSFGMCRIPSGGHGAAPAPEERPGAWDKDGTQTATKQEGQSKTRPAEGWDLNHRSRSKEQTDAGGKRWCR